MSFLGVAKFLVTTAVNIPGFIAGVVTCLFGILLAGLAFVFFFLHTTTKPKHHLTTLEETAIREELLEQWEKTTSEDHHQAYRCGWVYIATEYQEKPAIDLRALQKMKGQGERSKPTGVYFLVLKHQSLFLYEGEEQVTCASIIVIEGCKVDLFPHTMLLDEIYQKVHPIRVISNSDISLYEDRPVIYLYAANASEKEDWLHSLRHAIKPATEEPAQSSMGQPNLTETIFMERLGRYLKGTDVNSQWLNAIVGRVFYNLFRAGDLERFFRIKFERKSSSTPLPFFLNGLYLKSVQMGQSLPMISKGQFHSVGLDGELTCSVDVFYPGGFKLTIATEFKCEIPRLKTITVPIVMSVQIRHFSGRMLLRIKPPPSDRLWYGFYSLPQLDLDVEPIVSSTAITWSVIKTSLVKHLLDELAENALLPNMDDLTIPPVMVGDSFGGEKPFELDFIPRSIIEEAKRSDLSAHGISSMPQVKQDEQSKEVNSPTLLSSNNSNNNNNDNKNLWNEGGSGALFAGSHNNSFSDIKDSADLLMDPLSRDGGGDSSASLSTKHSPGLLDGARRSDILAKRTRTPTSPVSSIALTFPSNASNSSNASTKEMIFNLKRSFSSLFKASLRIDHSPIQQQQESPSLPLLSSSLPSEERRIESNCSTATATSTTTTTTTISTADIVASLSVSPTSKLHAD